MIRAYDKENSNGSCDEVEESYPQIINKLLQWQTVRVAKEGTLDNLADIFTKLMPSACRTYLLGKFTY